MSKRGWTMGAAVLLVAGTALAQPEEKGRGRGGFMGGMRGDSLGLLQNADVKKALKITPDEDAFLALLADEQRKKDDSFNESLRDASREERMEKFREHMSARSKEIDKQVGEILGVDRSKRLKQIRLQVMGPSAILMSPEVSSDLGVTESQREDLQSSLRDSMREVFGALRSAGEDEAARKKIMTEMRAEQEKKVLAVLTTEQKKKWEQMLGPPIGFTVDLTPQFGRRRERSGDSPDGNRPRNRRRDDKKKDSAT